MKKIIVAALVLIITSCKKENEQKIVKQDEKRYKITFAVSGFEQNVTDLNTVPKKLLLNSISADGIKDQINQLAFVIYDEAGDEFIREIQFSDDPEFGTYEVELPLAPLYSAVVVGSKTSFGINTWYKPFAGNPVILPLKKARMMYEQENMSPFDHVYKTDDTFFRKIMFTVYPQVETQNIILQRIVGKLEVKVEDVNSYAVRVLNEATDYMFETETSAYQIEDDFADPVSNATKPISLYILRTDTLLNILIEGGGVIKPLSIPIFKNKRTIVTGKLLAETAKTPFKVSVDDEWLADTVAIKF